MNPTLCENFLHMFVMDVILGFVLCAGSTNSSVLEPSGHILKLNHTYGMFICTYLPTLVMISQ